MISCDINFTSLYVSKYADNSVRITFREKAFYIHAFKRGEGRLGVNEKEKFSHLHYKYGKYVKIRNISR